MQDAIQQQTQTTHFKMTRLPGQSFIIPSEHSEIRQRWKNQAPPGVLQLFLQLFKLCGNKWKKSQSLPKIHPFPKKSIPQVKILDHVTIQKKNKSIIYKNGTSIFFFFMYTGEFWVKMAG